MTIQHHASIRAGTLAEPCHGCGERGSLYRVLVIGDDRTERGRIAGHFAGHDCPALEVDSDRAIHRLSASRFSLVVLDIDFAASARLTLLNAIRARSLVPVIVTAANGEPADLVTCLEAGADDVLRKPLDLDELFARARATLRRQGLGRIADLPSERGFRFDGWELRENTRTLRNPGGAFVSLTKTEFALLVVFLRAPRRPLSRLHLIRATRAHEDVADRSIDVQILRLRRKLEPNIEPRRIRTVRGFGYLFDGEVETIL